MMRVTRALVVWGSLSMAAPCYAAVAGDTSPPPAGTGATEVQPAAPPSKPAVMPTGFPALIIPGAILIGIAAAVATEENSAEFPTGTSTTGTTP